MLTRRTDLGLLAACLALGTAQQADAGQLAVLLRPGEDVTFVGAIRRWDADGNTVKPVNPKARIDSPEVTAVAKRAVDGTWVFASLSAGRYDLVVLRRGRVRVEGFHYPPVREFDPFFPATGKEPAKEDRDIVVQDIARGKHYENKVAPLFLAGDSKAVRVLVQLVRDEPTSYDGEVGYSVATVRHEVWQYSHRYGGWSKERATKILDRVLLPRAEFRRWTWVWEPRLGGIEVRAAGVVRVDLEMQEHYGPEAARGWFPN
jgi:hypothetical protein